MQAVALVFIGGGLGAALRHLLNSAALRAFGAEFPWGILGINVAGSLLMGLIVGWAGARAAAVPHVMLFLTTGVLGGFTTFSTFSLDAVALWERGAVTAAVLYVAGSVGLAVLGLLAGLMIGRGLA
jgi:fluoride exporter